MSFTPEMSSISFIAYLLTKFDNIRFCSITKVNQGKKTEDEKVYIITMAFLCYSPTACRNEYDKKNVIHTYFLF